MILFLGVGFFLLRHLALFNYNLNQYRQAIQLNSQLSVIGCQSLFLFINPALNILTRMKNQRATDSNPLIRAFFLHCFIQIYQVITSLDPTHVFRAPRFELFQKIRQKYKKGDDSLFKNILLTFRWHIVKGGIICCIYVSFNMLVPELIKMFMHFMHEAHSEKSEINRASNFIRNLVGVQILRMVFGEHTRRIFHELAIKVESTLSKMLIQKSLTLDPQARRDIPQSQILQLENVDLKLVSMMINNMMLIFEAPLTIIIALVMLFIENKTYGFIGVYWFLIAFLLHRQLDQKMTHCNLTKLGLIQKRSKANYQLLYGMKYARMIGWQDIIVQRNNDLFQQQNHDHKLFYFYNSLYDIILLMLPVLVVVTICVVDVNEAKHIKVEQVYLMLSLLGICYEPMKSFRTISISFHDGLHSLNRIQQYFDIPEEKKDHDFVTDEIDFGHMVIGRNTGAVFPNTMFDFHIRTLFQIEMGPGERLVFLGRKGQGKSAFLSMINGHMTKLEGRIRIKGKKACLSNRFFFMKSTVRENIIFNSENLSLEELQRVAEQLGINEQLKKSGGLSTPMDDLNIFSKSLLQRISIARVLCSGAQIYILDKPFQFLQQKYEVIVENLLRHKQSYNKVLIIMTMSDLFNMSPEDKLAVINNGIVEQYGPYGELVDNKIQAISSYFRTQEDKMTMMSPIKNFSASASSAKNKFKNAIRKVTAINNAVKGITQILSPADKDLTASKKQQIDFKRDMAAARIDILLKNLFDQEQVAVAQKQQVSRGKVSQCLLQFVFCIPVVQIGFIMLIIACAQLLHVFIHFFIGHLEQQHGDHSYLKFRGLIIIEVLLTLCLAGILYYEGEVSSLIAVAQGNSMYKKSLLSLISKKISYFIKQYPVKIADRFNHDYEQVFIACHSLLTIYKNLIILIVTVVFISSDGLTVLIFFSVVILLYTTIYYIFRNAQKNVIKHYYDYKYGFVKCLEQSLHGAEYFDAFDCKHFIIKRAEAKYKRLASYKLAEKYNNYGLSIACDIIGNLLLASIVYYGLEVKLHHTRSNIALIATSIHLLMNGSQVLKNILKETINFQTFFSINLIPFIELINKKQQPKKPYERPQGYNIKFDELFLVDTVSQKSHNLSLSIKQGEHVFIYERSQAFRNLILYSLTNNLEQLDTQHYQKNKGALYIGYCDIRQMDPSQVMKMVGVIMSKNFFFSGTLRENLVRKIIVDEEELKQYIKVLKLDEDLEDYDLLGLETPIEVDNSHANNDITKKLALLRILLYKSKIVIIKDTSSFIGTLSIIDTLRQYIPDCTIIKIDARIEAAIGAQRVIYMENAVVLEDGLPAHLMAKPTSIMGNMLKDINMEDYLFKNKVSSAKMKRKFTKRY